MTERQPRMRRTERFSSLAFLCLFALAGPAEADPDNCSTSNGIATCKGNQSAGIRNGKDFSSGITHLEVNDLQAGIGPSLSGNTNSNGDQGGIILQYSGTDGDTPTTITLNYDATNNGTSYEIHTTADGSAGIYIHNTSEHGGSGDVGETGHHGKNAFSIAVSGEPLGFMDAGGFGSVGIELFTQAGNGGEGGADDTPGLDGGDGGEGGLGGDINLETGSATIHTTGTDGIGVSAISVGGEGGGGGDGGGHGGAGGTGGDGGGVFLDTTDNWTIETEGGGTSPAVVLQSLGGNGGNGKGGGGDGGHGGDGGNGGSVNISTLERGTWTIATSGDSESHGFSLLSQGGSGSQAGQGDGGHGGNGGHGGQGGAINIATLGAIAGSITTIGSQSHGIYAVSKAGAGGDGGAGETVGDGGDGGAGGGGGAINILGEWSVTTSGTQSHGIAAYSLGAQGGNGGDSEASKGGSGGDTGLSGNVVVDVDGEINTTGAGSIGIVAQSVAGHAGSGGGSTGLVAFAANGGSAGAGGDVTVSNGGAVTTISDEALAIAAQSVGGGGGHGGTAFSDYYSSGGEGGQGGNGGAVTVNNSGALNTSGQGGVGIMAYSVGGGGGSGGFAAGIVSFGGRGGGGGDGGDVSVTNSGSIVTGAPTELPILSSSDPGCGDDGGCAHGILAQSIGGGGGSGGSAFGWFSVGGVAAGSNHGDGGGAGGQVFVHNSGLVFTTYDNSSAILAQSVGGGGGHGGGAGSIGAIASVSVGGSGGNGGAGGIVSVLHNDEHLTTDGDYSHGIHAQSVGGGGGHGGYAVSASFGVDTPSVAVAVGGSGGTGGDGNSAGVCTLALDANGFCGDANSTAVTTSGDHAYGILAQSIGGGGGNGGFSIAFTAGEIGTASVAVGGSGGSGGLGLDVFVGSGSAITTFGDHSPALAAQSIGGGGGNGGFAISGSLDLDASGFGIAIGGKGGSGGDADTATVVSQGPIVTHGMLAPGILAQSIGGGGGNGGTSIAASISTSGGGSVNVAVGGSGGSGGNGDEVNVSATGTVGTSGDNSNAITAQSIGGGGGNGGVSIAASVGSSFAANVAVGGSGGGSGAGGAVTVQTGDALTTAGDSSVGILAQSVSNGGGNGGLTITGDAISGGDTQVAVAGSGGNAKASGEVTVVAGGAITSSGEHATAIVAQSLAGGGGRAVGGINGTLGSMGEVGVTVGGSGGAGGTAGAVSVTTNTQILTSGDWADGILAQSAGGNGGHGGFAIEGSLTGGEYSGSANVTIGGAGGNGGAAGIVTVMTAAGTLETQGYTARGIVAQSVGGSGGNGGSVYSGNLTMSSSVGVDVAVDIGGGGGSGGTAAMVSVTNAATIQTAGYYSDAILAQSIGGDGGNGGNSYSIVAQLTADSSASFAVTLGGSGGSGHDGGAVSVSNHAGLTTLLDSSPAIFAQSIGGGGGRGGSAGTMLFDLTKMAPPDETTVEINAAYTMGGTGGSAGDGGEVTVESFGTITTSGVNSSGIYAQSIGGGGGNGGSASSMVMNVTGSCTFQVPLAGWGCTTTYPDGSSTKTTYTPTLEVSVGGNGGAGGDGGAVSINNAHNITTLASTTDAIFAQSVGGGGGHGGYGALGTQTWSNSETVQEFIDYTESLVDHVSSNLRSWQSLKIAIGGTGGAAGNGGDVTVTNSALVETHGDYSYAINTQSIGGGGGSGGAALGGFGQLLQVNVGGGGSGGGDGGHIQINQHGTVRTLGDNAVAIFAQSVGGGGGKAGDVEHALAHDFGSLNVGLGVGIQLAAGNGGNGGNIAINVNGAITTTGEVSHGIFAHSVGGSGGAAHLDGADLDPFDLVGSIDGDAGSGGDITIQTTAPITVSGDGAHGIFAQSVSGTISEDDKPSTAGNVTVNIGADVTASGGDFARALLLQSEGFDSNGVIAVTVQAGATVSTTTDGDVTIGIMDGKSNTITNLGSIIKPESGSLSGYVIYAEKGELAISNSGLLAGSILLDSEDNFGNPIVNSLDNSGTLGLGIEVNLNKNSTLSNAGIMTAATVGTIGTSAVTGKVVQTAAGTLGVDLDTTNDTVDLLNITETAGLAGTVQVNVVDVGADSGTVTILTATGGVSAATQTDLAVEQTAVAAYTLSYPNANEIQLSYSIDFTNDAVLGAANSNQQSVTQHIQAIHELQALDDILKSLVNIAGLDDYLAALDSLAPQILSDNQRMALLGSLQFSDAMLSCAARTGTYRFVSEEQCGWLRFGGIAFQREATSENRGFDQTTWQIAGGGQLALGDDWWVGGALGVDFQHLEVEDNLADSDGVLLQAGVVAKKGFGNTMLAASFSGGYGSYDVTRHLFSGDDHSSTEKLWMFAGQLSAAHTITLGENFYVRPRADFGITHVRMSGLDEDGGASLEVEDSAETYFDVQPSIEFGGEFTAGSVLLRPSVSIGVTQFLGDAAPSVTASFNSAPFSVEPFTIESELDKTYLDLRAGVDVFAADNLVVSVEGFGQLSQHTSSYGGGLKLAISF